MRISDWSSDVCSSDLVLSNSPSPPTRVGITGLPAGPLSVIAGAPLTAPTSEICDTPVKPTPSSAAVVPCSTGTPSFTSIRPRTNCGSAGHIAIYRTSPDGPAEHCTCPPWCGTATDCLKQKFSYAFVPPIPLASQHIDPATPP